MQPGPRSALGLFDLRGRGRASGATAATFTPTVASSKGSWAVALAFTYVFALAAIHLPAHVFDPTGETFILAIGLIGAWRYSWWTLHGARALYYRRSVFPSLRRRADALGAAARPSEVFVLITSYQIEPETTYRVYDALVKNAVAYGVPTTILAAISDRRDVAVLEEVMADNGRPAGVEIAYVYQQGDGKRSAMAEVLRAIARRLPEPDAVVVFMDGDIRLPPGTFARTMPFFFLQPDLGALTTDNRGIVAGGDWAREWYDLRYAQRHLMMCSLALSRRLMVLTGRYSVIRADLATRPDFIQMVGEDEIDHWRLGRFRLLSGDDKSTWFWLLKNGWRMLYVPDVQVHGFEALPQPNAFVSSTVALMTRWYGNMLRTNGRAAALGPRRTGFFIWWCLIDQRFSMWTSLVGPTATIMLIAFVRADFGLVYLLWIMTTRLIVAVALGLQRRRFSPMWPVLLYFNQIAGAALKTWVSFRLNRQKWTRQGISTGEPEDLRLARRQRRQSAWIHGTAVGAFITALSFAIGVLQPPDEATALSLAAAVRVLDEADDYWISPALRQAPVGATVHLPEGRFHLSDLPWRIRADSIEGKGAERSVLVLNSAPLARRFIIDQPLEPGRRVQCGPGGASCFLYAGREVRLAGLSIVFPVASDLDWRVARLSDR